MVCLKLDHRLTLLQLVSRQLGGVLVPNFNEF